jgi:BlaI family penicillinase repressor
MIPKISSSEWEVMNVVWANAPLTAVEVFQGLPLGHGWKQKTVNTFLARLVEKRILSVDRTGRAFVYSARVSRKECVQAEGVSFLEKVFRGATSDLVLHFCEHGTLTTEEIHELERLLASRRRKP